MVLHHSKFSYPKLCNSICGHPLSSMAFKSSESCKILNHNNDNVNKNQKKNCTRKIMPILCMPQAQYGENYEP